MALGSLKALHEYAAEDTNRQCPQARSRPGTAQDPGASPSSQRRSPGSEAVGPSVVQFPRALGWVRCDQQGWQEVMDGTTHPQGRSGRLLRGSGTQPLVT